MTRHSLALLAIASLTGLAAHAAPNSDVQLTQSAVTADHVLTTTVGGNETGQKVLIDLELYDSDGHKLAQAFQDKVIIPAHKSVDMSLTPPATLSAGTYYYSVGIFTSDWKGLVHWYDRVQSFTIGSTTSQQIFVVRVDRPKLNLPNGSTATIAPTLINTGPTLTDVIVTVSLWRGGNFIDDETFMHQTFPQNVEKTFEFTTIPLMQGSYTIKTQVTNSSGTILQNFPDLGLLAVNP
jgi:hypothetical protein